MEQKCPMCGCRMLRESNIIGYKCDNCGELFEVTDKL
jgi:tRNA(Ile2) C34 agmatinyltransferase TiaS